MKKLHVGNDAIAIKDAVVQVQKNIEELSSKKQHVDLGGYAGKKILEFMKRKSQRNPQHSPGSKTLFEHT